MEKEEDTTPKQPDQKKHDKLIKDIKAEIKAKEAKIKSVAYKAPSKSRYITEHERLTGNLVQLTTRVQEIKATKQLAEASLLAVNREIQSKSEKLTKLQAKLPYKNQQRADAVINRLQAQLGQRNLKLREERQLVAEIDTLNCCKKNIEEYHIQKGDLDELRNKQKAFRADREHHNKVIGSIKLEEVQTKQLLNDLKQQQDLEWKEYRAKFGEQEGLGKSINELYRQKRELLSRFHFEKQAWAEHTAAMNKNAKKTPMKSSSRRRRPSERSSELDQSITVCDALIGYVKRCLPPTHADALSDSPAPSTEVVRPPTTQLSAEAGPVGEYLLNKDAQSSADGICFGVVRKPSKRNKRGKRTSTSETGKKLFHNSVVFGQFLSLDIEPPLTTADVPSCVSRLSVKMAQLKALALMEKRSWPNEGDGQTAQAHEPMQSCLLDPPDSEATVAPLASVSKSENDDDAVPPDDDGRVVETRNGSLQSLVDLAANMQPQTESRSGNGVMALATAVNGVSEEDAASKCIDGDRAAVECDRSELRMALFTDINGNGHHATSGSDAAHCVNGQRYCGEDDALSVVADSDDGVVLPLPHSMNGDALERGSSSLRRRCRSWDSFHVGGESPRSCNFYSKSIIGGSQTDMRDAIAVQSDS